MLGRISKLLLVALLAVGLGVGFGQGRAQPIVGAAQTTVSATPVDCGLCEHCGKPCIPAAMCGPIYVSLGFGGTAQPALARTTSDRLVPLPDWQLYSAELSTPTAPPRLSHFI